MRKITSLLLLLFCAVTVLSARENKYDRGIVMKTFIPKGQWMVGATFSYSEHVDDNFEFMSLLKDIDSEGDAAGQLFHPRQYQYRRPSGLFPFLYKAG